DVLAFLEVDFTTEGSQPYRGSRLVDGTCEGTPFFYQEGSVHLGLEPKITLDLPAHRLCLDVDRGVFGYGGIDVSGVAVEPVFAGVAEITVILNLSARRTHAHQRPGHGSKSHVPAH